ncbi:hypothetical protein IAD21_01532 [Abditibacteriota bacterium]|nr:hypothetical protein IAD21_01532 [Abditibacteriota bacterium]
MKTKRATRPRNARIVWAWRALLLLLPLVLAGGAWKVHQLQEPISVGYGPEDIQSRVLFERLGKEAVLHPYANKISIFWSKPWPKESGLDLYFNESLEWNRQQETLAYITEDYGWTYSHVERRGVMLLAKAHLAKNPITLPPALHSRLRRLGWTLTEHYLP